MARLKKAQDPLYQRGQLVRQLLLFREMLPGSLVFRQRICGRANCTCMRQGRLHPGYQVTVRLRGKTQTYVIPEKWVTQVRDRVRLRKRFEQVVEEILWINLHLLLAKKRQERTTGISSV